jgi:hypothetical protein
MRHAAVHPCASRRSLCNLPRLRVARICVPSCFNQLIHPIFVAALSESHPVYRCHSQAAPEYQLRWTCWLEFEVALPAFQLILSIYIRCLDEGDVSNVPIPSRCRLKCYTRCHTILCEIATSLTNVVDFIFEDPFAWLPSGWYYPCLPAALQMRPKAVRGVFVQIQFASRNRPFVPLLAT